MSTRAPKRTHVLLPPDIVEAVDRLVGQRRRSQFLADAAREKLQRIDAEHRFTERVTAARAAAGSLADRHIPEWATTESADAWVRQQRRARDQRLAEELERS